MPSHVTHLLFAEESVRASGHSDLVADRVRPYLILGAQGPDIFYHNQRRRPTGLAYGSLMHRHGYGTAVSWMVDWARERGFGRSSWPVAWAVGFASHAILDRAAHPYINAHSGWVDHAREETSRFRTMHPFLERLIDVELLRRERGVHPNDLDFVAQADCGASPPDEWTQMMRGALARTYPKAARDSLLPERLESAYLDALGFYRFTNRVDRDYLERGLSRNDDVNATNRWLALVHPRAVPEEIDVLNLGHREWLHPCDPARASSESFVDRYQAGLAAAAVAIGAIMESFDATRDAGRERIEEAVGNHNLSDGFRTERPCRKTHADPLPLADLRDRIRRSIIDGRGGIV